MTGRERARVKEKLKGEKGESGNLGRSTAVGGPLHAFLVCMNFYAQVHICARTSSTCIRWI